MEEKKVIEPNKKAIQAIMVGASRSGKTSILASMLMSYRRNTSLTQEMSLRDTTSYPPKETKQYEQMDLDTNVSGMQDMLKEEDGGRANMGSLIGTQYSFEYSFTINTKASQLRLDEDLSNLPPVQLSVYDVPGEAFQAANNQEQYDEILKVAEKSQVLIVAVDTPSMMYAKAKKKEAYKRTVNCLNAVQDLVDHLGLGLKMDNNTTIPLLIVFVPIKCEYWAQGIDGHSLDEVNRQIRDIYKIPISQLGGVENQEGRPNTKILIMPVQTIGGLVFDHHTTEEKMKLLVCKKPVGDRYKDEDKGTYSSRCEKDGEDIILPDGSYYELEEEDELTDVPHVFPYSYSYGEKIPYAWFKAKENGEYSPENCDQLLLEILKFNIQSAALTSDFTVKKMVEGNFGFWTRLAMKKFYAYQDTRQLRPLCIRIHKMIKEGKFKNNYTELYNTLDKRDARLSFDF